jgi:hypothetical protein
MALGPQTFFDLGAGLSDIFAGFPGFTKAAAAAAEAQSYEEAATLAQQNAQYTQVSTALQQRELNLSLGRNILVLEGIFSRPFPFGIGFSDARGISHPSETFA